MKRVLAVLGGIALAVNAQATVTLNIDAEALKNQSGVRIPEGSGLVLVVADTLQNGFAGFLNIGSTLALGGFLNGGDDQIVARYAVESGGFGAGDFEVAATGLTLGGGWGAGDGLAIYWFSDATTASASYAAPMHYNQNAATKDANWVTPSDGSLVSMQWFTTDATDLSNGGNVPAAAGNASIICLDCEPPPEGPEPSSISLVGFGLIVVVGLLRRRS